MGRPVQWGIAVALLLITAGVTEVWEDHGGTFGAVIGLILLGGIFLGLAYYAYQIKKLESGAGDTSDIDVRLQSLERRLSDIQDIVISIDDQLGRERQTNAGKEA